MKKILPILLVFLCLSVTPVFADTISHHAFDECSDTSLADSVGSHDATAVNTSWNMEGVSGCAIDFDGSVSSGYVMIPNDTAYVFGTGEFAISLWHKVIVDEGEYILSMNDGNWYWDDWLVIDSACGSHKYQTSFGNSSDTVGYCVNSNYSTEWQHILFQRDETGNVSTYINGVLENSTIDTVPYDLNLTHNIYIGGVPTDDFGYISGSVDEVWFFDDALIEEEIFNIYTYNSLTVPAEEPTEMQTMLAQIGDGLGSFLNAIGGSLANLLLTVGAVMGIASMFYAIAYSIKSSLSR